MILSFLLSDFYIIYIVKAKNDSLLSLNFSLQDMNRFFLDGM